MTELALVAFGLGLLSASALLVGAILGLLADLPDRLVAAVMGFGAGALISALTFDLVAEGHKKAGFAPVAVGFLAGSVIFVLANQAINERGGFLRKPATLYRFLRELRWRHTTTLLEHMSRVDLLRALPPEEVSALVPFIEDHHYRAGQVICKHGVPSDALCIIESGAVDVYADESALASGTSSAVGAEKAGVRMAAPPLVRTIGPGEAFGHAALLPDDPHSETAVAKLDVHLWRIRKDRLDLLAERSSRLARALDALRISHLAATAPSGALDEAHQNIAAPMDAARWLAEAKRHLNRSRVATTSLTPAEHQQQVRAHAAEGTGAAIFLGALLDGIPESFVIGSSLLGEAAFSPVLVVAVFLSNLPEALSSAASMRHHGSHPGRVLSLWGALIVFSGIAALLGNILLVSAPDWLIAGAEALAAGGILAMLADTMLPEAFEQGGPLIAIWTSLGFLAAFFVKSMTG